jgi:hypothetical protein
MALLDQFVEKISVLVVFGRQMRYAESDRGHRTEAIALSLPG